MALQYPRIGILNYKGYPSLPFYRNEIKYFSEPDETYYVLQRKQILTCAPHISHESRVYTVFLKEYAHPTRKLIPSRRANVCRHLSSDPQNGRVPRSLFNET